MKLFCRVAAWLLLAAALLAAPGVIARLPNDGREALLRQSDDFSGVLRLWVCEGFEAGNGSLSSWLMGRIRRFESSHPGVYVQLRAVSSEVMRDFAGGELNPPDIILFAPGMLDGVEHLKLLDGLSLRGELMAAGEWQDGVYAVPVAMGGYAWALNRAMLSELPSSWVGLAQPGTAKKPAYLLQAPADGDFLSWSAALLSLSLRAEDPVAVDPPKAGEGLDLGLPQPTGTVPPQVEERVQVSLGLPDALPTDFRKLASAYNAFIKGQAAAMPVTQREIRRLALLSETGRAPDVVYDAVEVGFTDQLAMMAVVDMPGKTDAAQRQALGGELIGQLLGAEAQQALSDARAFPVIDGLRLYAAQPGMAEMEAALADRALWVPNAFDNSWRDRASELADRFQSGGISAGDALSKLIG